MTNDLMAKLVDFSDDDSMEGFLDAVKSGRVAKSVDLMAANPDIRDQVSHGWYTLNLYSLEYKGVSFYAVETEDGDDGELSEDWISSTYYVTEDFADAARVLDDWILGWKSNWDF